MNRKQVRWLIPLIMALLVTGCGNDPKTELKQPSVYRNPQVRITHAPTEVVANVATVEAEASAFPTDPMADSFDDFEQSPEEVDQSMMAEIEALLDRIESELDRMDTNP